MHDSPTVEILLGHGRFIRILARELVRDAHAAEDLAQEAHARWLEHGAAGLARPRAWLRRVLRNLAANQAEAEHGRRAREQAKARADSAPSTADSVAEAELLQAVGAAVLALEEPYRSTILARYYHGLDARQLAEESGTPLATVRSREQRALAQLRERLDRERGGREGWALALARLGGGAAPAAIPLWFALTCVAGSLALWVVAWQVRAARSAVETASATTTEATLASSPPAFAPGAPAPAPTIASTGAARVASAPSSPAASQASSIDPSLAVVKGRLLLADGSPASHTHVEVDGWTAGEDRAQSFGLTEDWQNPTTETDDQGSFAIAFVPPGAFQFVVRTERSGFADACWRWMELRPGVTKDLGEVVLQPAGVIEGRLVDAQDRPLSGAAARGWQVSARTVGLRDFAGRDETGAWADVTEDGTFRIEGVYPGMNSVRASSNAARIEGPNVRVEPGQRFPLDLVYRGPDLGRRVTVVVRRGDLAPLDVPAASSVHLLGSDRTARALPDSLWTYAFDDVEPGAYAVAIDDPRCRPWLEEGVQPGVPVGARVVGAAALALSVLDADGTSVPSFAVRVRALGNGVSVGDHLLHDGRTPLEGGLLTDLYAGDYVVTVLAGVRSARATVSDLGANEARALTLRFESHPSHVAGRVLRPSGEPVAHAHVRLIRPALVGDSDATPILPATGSATTTPERFRHELAVVESSADGGFQFDATEAGAFVLEASTTGARVLGARFALTAGESRDGLELALGAPASLRGRALGPPGARFEGLSLALRRASVGSAFGDLDAPVVVRLKSDGSFACANAPTGELEVWLALPQQNGGANPILSLDAFGSGQTISNERLVTHVTLVAGSALERELDVAAIFPATVVVEVDFGGAPTSGVYVTWLPHERGGPDAGTSRTVPADSNGTTPPATLFPGAWDALVFSSREHWLCVHPVPLDVAPGARAELVVPVRRHPGTITCLDASGRPFANQEFNLADAEERFYLSPALRTDASGDLELSLPPGTYRLRKLQFGTSGPVAELHWTESGPSEARVRF